MKKLSLLIALAMLISITGVYATWVYSQSDDVADITNARAITMTNATFEGTYGTYNTDATSLTMKVDPKADYDAYDAALTTGQITLTVSDGKNSSTITSD